MDTQENEQLFLDLMVFDGSYRQSDQRIGQRQATWMRNGKTPRRQKPLSGIL